MPRPTVVRALAGLCLSLSMQGCVATTVAGAAVHVAATGVKAGAKVAGATVGVAADAVGATGRVLTGRK